MATAHHDWQFSHRTLTLAEARVAWDEALAQATDQMGHDPSTVKVQLQHHRRASDASSFEAAMADLGVLGTDKIDSIWPIAMWLGAAESTPLALQLESAAAYSGWHVSGTEVRVADAIAETLLTQYPASSATGSLATPTESVTSRVKFAPRPVALERSTSAHRIVGPIVSHPYWSLVVGLASLLGLMLGIAAFR